MSALWKPGQTLDMPIADALTSDKSVLIDPQSELADSP
jgi:hypothetical protein